jgi:A1 cistron-splicing factor AAR2
MRQIVSRAAIVSYEKSHDVNVDFIAIGYADEQHDKSISVDSPPHTPAMVMDSIGVRDSGSPASSHAPSAPLTTTLAFRPHDALPLTHNTTTTTTDPTATTALVARGIPTHFTIGLDALSFSSTAAPFAGVGGVPPGPHFMWVAEGAAALATRSGAWVLAGGRDAVVEWDAAEGVLRQGGPALDNADHDHPRLVPYAHLAEQARSLPSAPADQEPAQAWRGLCSCISRGVLARVLGDAPTPDGPWGVQTTDRVCGARMLAAEIELDNQLSAAAAAEASRPSWSPPRELCFSFSQSERTFDASAVGAARTAGALDSTAHVLSRIRDLGLADADVVGELQLAFVCGAHLGNEACVRQWCHLAADVFLRAYGLVDARPRLAAACLSALAAQLRHADEGLESVDDIGLGDGAASKRMRIALGVYKRRLQQSAAAASASSDGMRVATAFQGVEAAAVRLGWDLRGDDDGGGDDAVLRRGTVTLEDGEEVELEMMRVREDDEERDVGEYAPAVVELDGDGREVGRYAWD